MFKKKWRFAGHCHIDIVVSLALFGELDVMQATGSQISRIMPYTSVSRVIECHLSVASIKGKDPKLPEIRPTVL